MPRISLTPPTRRRSPLGPAALVGASALLHGLAIALLLVHRSGRGPPPPPAPLEIELVQQRAEVRGAPTPSAPTPSAPTPSAPTPPAPTSTPPAPTPPASAPQAAAAAPSPASPPLPPAPQAPPPAKPSPQAGSTPEAAPPPPPAARLPPVHLGSGLNDVDPLVVTGTNVVPARPDARYRNEPPHYPEAAARIGAEGTVQVVAHIGPTGQPFAADIAQSSGNADLDDEAQRAVMRWHFTPARAGGRAVPFDYVINMRFSLAER